MLGIYSLVTDEWLKKPKKEDPEVDFAAISNKAASIANEIIRNRPLCIRKNTIVRPTIKPQTSKEAQRDATSRFRRRRNVFCREFGL